MYLYCIVVEVEVEVEVNSKGGTRPVRGTAAQLSLVKAALGFRLSKTNARHRT